MFLQLLIWKPYIHTLYTHSHTHTHTRAGVKVGDILVAVDMKAVENRDKSEMLALIKVSTSPTLSPPTHPHSHPLTVSLSL